MGFIENFRSFLGIETRDASPNDNPLEIHITDKQKINYENAAWASLEVNTIHACVNVIAGAVGRLPLVLYKRKSDGSREKAIGHRLYTIAGNPNPEMTAMSFFYALTANLLLYGNAYVQKIMTKDGLKLCLIPSRYVSGIKINKDGTITYNIAMTNDEQVVQGTFTDKEILHIVGDSLDGIHGLSPIQLLHNTVEFSKILELYGKKYFENGASLTGTLSAPNGVNLSPEAAERLQKTISKKYSGIDNIGSIMVLEDGFVWQSIQSGNDSSQFLQTKESMIAEVARIFNVPLHLLQETSKSTSWGTGIEQMGIDFVTYTLDVHLKRIEQAFNSLLDIKDRGKFYFEFNTDALQRGNLEGRYRAYQIGLMCGFISPNEIRQKENMPKIDGGDVYCLQLNQPPYAGADKDKYMESIDNGDTIQDQ